MSELTVSAPPLVLIHGAWHGAWCWEGVATDLRAQGRDVHAITLPFHDQPGDRTRIWSTVGSYLAKIDDIVSQLARPPILVGHSMGGYLTQRFLETRSDAVAGAVLVAALPRQGARSMVVRSLRQRPAATVRSFATLNPWAIVGDVAPDLFLGPDAPPSSVALLEAKLQNESALASITMLVRQPKRARITAPLLVIAAERDATFLLSEQRDLAAALGTELAVVPGGHDVMLDTGADQLVEHLLTWDPVSAPARTRA